MYGMNCLLIVCMLVVLYGLKNRIDRYLVRVGYT